MSKIIEFEGKKHKVAGRDFIEVTVPPPVIEMPPVEMLSVAQRKQLNAMVQEISDRHKEQAPSIWRRVVHIPFGVEKLADIPAIKYTEVEQALQDFSHSLALVGMINTRAEHKQAVKQVAQYALEQFGVYDLKRLKPAELKHLMDYLSDLPPPNFGLPFEAKPIGISHRKPVSNRVKPTGLKRWWRMMQCLTLRWPGHVAAVALASALVSKMFL